MSLKYLKKIDEKESFLVKRPDLASQWDYKNNGELRPELVTCYCTRLVWWIYPYDDPETGKHFDFSWQQTVEKRCVGSGECPFIIGKRVWIGYNDLQSKAPELAKQWHPTKNLIKPTEITYGSGKKVWWIQEYVDPKTKRTYTLEWEAEIQKRYGGEGCPYLSGKKILCGFNDLQSASPDLSAQLHPTKNKGISPSEIFAFSNKKYWWLYSYDDPKTGKHFEFVWDASPASRMKSPGCPFLCGQRLWKGYNDLQSANPELSKQWNYKKNIGLTPENIMANARKKAWWIYPYDDSKTGKHFDFEWRARVYDRNRGAGCPFLAGEAVWPGFNDLASNNPELAKEWDYKKNHKMTPECVSTKSNKTYWWLCEKCGRSWRSTVAHRATGSFHLCPYTQ